MAIAYVTALRNTRMDAIDDACNAGSGAALIRIYDGTRPATGGTATTLLAELTASDPMFGASASGVLTASAITQESSGSQTATISTEHTLATITTTKTFILSVDCANLAAGEYVEIKVKRDVRSADTTRTLHSRIVSWLEASVTPIIQMPPVPAGGGEFVCTLKQLNGTGRAFPWAVDTPG